MRKVLHKHNLRCSNRSIRYLAVAILPLYKKWVETFKPTVQLLRSVELLVSSPSEDGYSAYLMNAV